MMASSETDHNYYTLPHRRRPSQLSNSTLPYDRPDDLHSRTHTSSPPPPSKSVPPLSSNPSYSDSSKPPLKRPTVTTSFDGRGLNALRHPSIDDASPDPHEFYRQYRDPFANAPGGLIGQGSILVSPVERGMTSGYGRKTSVSSVQSNGTLNLHSSQRPAHRSASISSTKSPLNTTKSTPILSAASGKSRQGSLKDLVDKFNQKPDELPPLPKPPSSKPASRATSRTVSPAGSAGQYSRSRNTSLSKPSGVIAQGPYEGRRQSRSSVTSFQKREGEEQLKSSVQSSLSHYPGGPRRQSVTTISSASQSLTNLNQSSTPAPRKPLFGEIVSLNTSSLAPGYGISSPRRRRGSEGSMHSPNPMFTDTFSELNSGISPSSPTAWYLGYTPSLDAINPNRPPNRPSHRRTQSDLASINRPMNTSSLSTHMATMSPPPEVPSGGNSGTASKRNSHSKIPISTRRLSATSDSGHSSSSTRANSAMGRYNTPKVNTPRGLSSLPKPMQQIPVSPPRHSQSPSMVKSPGRRDMGQKPTSSPLLKANIIAPPPKKSPPLRSSRPRQPVSTASTSASRAKMVERLNTLEIQDRYGNDRTRSKQNKMLPELGKVDFAARRQKIQQAFNKTVQENKLKEERAAERRRLAHEQQERDHQQSLASQQTPKRPMEQHFGTDDENDPSHEEQETFATPSEEFPRRQLTIDTSNVPGQRTVKDSVRYNDDDSPTLGVPSNVATANTEFPPSASDMPPMSAMTTDTTDTADTAETDSTTFENEPQTDRPMPNPLHRTVLSQIMQMRESSPGSQSHSDHGDDSFSERDDKESIQIMLREAPAEEITPGFEDALAGEDKDGKPNEIPPNRLSTSSWTSSIRDRQSTDWAADSPMEKIEETSPQPDSSDHHSFTTADSNHTPQSWSPATFTSPQTTHSTTDSAVGQPLPLHRDPALLSPATRQSYIQQILTQSPDLARQGGWDPKRVTQLYLQELARGTSRRQAVPAPLKLQQRETEESAREGGSPSQLSPETARERTSEDSRPSMDSLDYEASSSPIDQRVIHRASMNSREDWEHNSPSVLEWMHPEGYEDSPVDNSEPSDGPTPPPNEVTMPDREGAETPRVTTTTNGPKLPEIDTGGALGLAIHVQSPQDSDSPTIPPPPLPTHSPPPPPPVRSKSADVVGEPPSSNSISPSIYDSNPPSSVFPTVTTAGIITGMSARGSDDSTQPSFANTTSVVDSRSSTQDRPSFDHRPSTDTQAKASTATPEQRRLNKRRHVIKELIDTEHSFGRDMKVVDDIYKGTSSSCLDLSVEDVKILFSNSDQIVQFSINFLDTLKQAGKPIYVMPKAQRYKNSRASTATGTSGTVDEGASVNGTELSDEDKDRQTFIGAVFGQNMARMEKVYAEYLKNHDAANKKLQTLQQNPKVTIWLKECRQWAADLTTAWDLDSLLVKPVQRVLKYPLLLSQLLEATPEDHPDFTAIDVAVREMTGVSFRINEMKKRADVVEQVINSRKRKESDVRTGLQKAFGRRTEKLRQQVGLSDMFEDRQYNMLEEKFGSNFFQLQVVMRDVEMYTSDVQNYMNRFYDFVQAIETYIDVGQSSHPEMESKWRKFRMSVKEISATALAEHLSSIRKSVIEPMITLLKMHDGPQRVISKRNKRLLDYARFKAMKDRGDKPDKKTTDQGEQFNALNIALRDELPKLFSLTSQLMEACLNNFVQIQTVWLNIWQRKLSFTIDEHGIPEDVGQIIHQWTGDFNLTEAQVLTLGICNGSLLAETVNLVNFLTPSTTLNGDETSSPRRPSTFGSNNRSASLSNDASPIVPPVDFGKRYSGSYTNSPHSEMYQHQNLSQPHANILNGRNRASSAVSGTPEIPLGQRSSTAPASAGPRPSTGTGRSTEPSPALPRLSIDTPAFNHLNPDRSSPLRPFSGQSGQSHSYFPNHPNSQPSPSPGQRYSGFFSSAMPMSDSPRTQTPGVDRMPGPGQSLHVLFLAASVYEFNIDRARREAGYPYLTYVAGEIFDVIGEKGELWLAKNQDDPNNQVGWIWNKHFAKLAAQ